MLAVFEGSARAHHLFEKALEKSRHRAVPQREDHDQGLRRHNPVPCLDQHLRQITLLEETDACQGALLLQRGIMMPKRVNERR